MPAFVIKKEITLEEIISVPPHGDICLTIRVPTLKEIRAFNSDEDIIAMRETAYRGSLEHAGEENEELAVRFVTGWKDVNDDEGNAVTFSEENLRAAINVIPGLHMAIGVRIIELCGNADVAEKKLSPSSLTRASSARRKKN